MSARDRRTALRPIVDRASGAFRGLRDAQVFALVPGGDPRPRPVRRLHHGAAEHQRDEPRGVRRRARPAARRRKRRSGPRAGPPQRAARRRQPQGQFRPAASRRARPLLERRQLDAVDRLGRPLRQRLHRSRAGEAGLCAGRRPLSRGSVRHRPVVRPQQPGRNGALLVLRQHWLADDADDARPLPRISLVRGAGPGGAGKELGPGDDRDREARGGDIPGVSVAWSGAVVPGTPRVRAGAAALRGLADRHLPLPRRALRKLVDPARRAAGGAARASSARSCSSPCAGSRTTCSCRSDC